MNSVIHSTSTACYRRTPDHQIWAYVENNKVKLQVSADDPNAGTKIYESSSEIQQGNKSAKVRDFMAALGSQNNLKIQRNGTGISLQLEDTTNYFGGSDLWPFTVQLKEKKRGARLDTLVLITLTQDNINGLSARTNRLEESLTFLDWQEPEPIFHETSKYKFKASFSARDKHIKTQLYLQDAQTGKLKQFCNIIDESYLDEFVETFGSMEILFEHLRSRNNYEVLYQKGRIRVINQPQTKADLQVLKQRAEKRRKLKKPKEDPMESKPYPSMKRLQSMTTESYISDDLSSLTRQNRKLDEQIMTIRGQMTNQFDKKMETQETKMIKKLRHELAMMEEQFSEKLFEISKGMQTSYQPMERKVDIQILEEWKSTMNKDLIVKMAQQDRKVKSHLMSLLSEAKRQLAIIIHKLRSEFDTMIKENQEKCMNSIDDLEIDLIKKIEQTTGNHNSSTKESITENQENDILSSSRFFKDVDWNPIEVDPNSAFYRSFTYDFNNLVVYNGGWQWTQLFTKTIIPHGKAISLQFKIIKSGYNAIAIGVSDRSNIDKKTSLSLRNSIAYWGDRQVWEGHKVKQEGSGFKSGQIVTMTVDTVKGAICWAVNNEIQAQHSSSILRDRSLHLMGYIEMYDKGDRISLLSYKLVS